MKVEATRAGTVAKLFGAAGLVGYFALMMVLFAAGGSAALDPDGLAFLIVGVVLAQSRPSSHSAARPGAGPEPEAGTDNEKLSRRTRSG